jgi:hypothetical protein
MPDMQPADVSLANIRRFAIAMEDWKSFDALDEIKQNENFGI